MKVQKERIANEILTQIFLNIEDFKNEKNQKIIDKLKEIEGNVVVFLSGDKDTKKALQCMIQTFKIEQ